MSTNVYRVILFVAAMASIVACGGQDYPEEVVVASAEEEPEVQSTQAALFGSDSCRNTDITVANLRERNGVETEIKVLKVKYFSQSEGRWYTENLSNEIVPFGFAVVWFNEDLAHAENDLLTQWRAYYKHREPNGNWSTTVYQTIDTPDEHCLAGHEFWLTVE